METSVEELVLVRGEGFWQYISSLYQLAESGHFTLEIVFMMGITFPIFYTIFFGITTAVVYKKAGQAMWKAFVPYTNVKAFCKIIYGESMGLKRYKFCVCMYFTTVCTGAFISTYIPFLLLFFPCMAGNTYYRLYKCFNIPHIPCVLLGIFSMVPFHGLYVSMFMSMLPQIHYIGSINDQKERITSQSSQTYPVQ